MKRKRTIVIAALLAILGVCFGINRVFDPFIEQVDKYPSGVGGYFDTGSYTINPETIIASLDRGETDVFTPELATPEVYTSVSEGPIPPWHQSDYLKIVNALHQFVWHETLDNWSLYRILFDTNCQDNPSGFAIGDFTYYRTVWINGRILYTAREMMVRPLDSDVAWGGGTNFPHPILGWKSVNLDKLKVTADDALRIAEENGGKAARLAVQMECSIHLKLDGYEGWHVWYSSVVTP